VDKFTLSDGRKSLAPRETNLDRKNMIDVRRYRVFSTSVGVQPRDVRRSPTSSPGETPKRKNAREAVGEDISSWIALEIFNIAQT